MNLPNKLTIFRIILVPIMVIIPFLGITGNLFGLPIQNLIILAIFIIASITDLIDGKIARKYNLVTTFGKFADPLADKILVLSAMLMLVEMGRLPAWVPIIILFREFVVSGYRLIAVQKGGEVIAANMWGKIKTNTQMYGVILMFLNNHALFDCFFATTNKLKALESSLLIYMPTWELVINILACIMIIVSVIATIISGWNYIKGGKDLLKD